MESPTQFAISAVPALALLAVGTTWPLWPAGWRELPAISLAVGLSLLVLFAAVALEIGAGVGSLVSHSPEALVGSLVAFYALTLFFFSLREDVSAWRLALYGVLSLLPGYHLVGFTLLMSACSLQSAGC